MVTQKMEKEKEESQRRLAAKDKLLSKRALHVNTLQGISRHVRPRRPCASLSVTAGSTWSPELRTSKFNVSVKAQLKDLAYNPRRCKPSVPVQYTWPAEEQDVMLSDDDSPFAQLKAGESLLEIHLKV